MNEKCCFFALMVSGLLVAGAFAQSKSAACPASTADDALVTICTYERGMVVSPQPQLYLRIFNEGRGEYERVTTGYKLTTKRAKIEAGAMAELRHLIESTDLVAKEYPRYRTWDDGSMTTTVTIRQGSSAKQIVLQNYSPDDRDKKLHYPASLIRIMQLAREIRDRADGVVPEIPSISFCDSFAHKDEYAGKKIEMYADLEYAVAITADGRKSWEREFLYDIDCYPHAPLETRMEQNIEAGYKGTPAQIDALKAKTRLVRDETFGGRGSLLVVGMLTADGKRFDITEIKHVERLILPYEGTIKLGWLYSDTVEHNPAKALALSSPLKLPYHHAGRVEFSNERDFPKLKTAGLKGIVFKPVSETIQKIGNRWDSTYRCDIFEVK